MKSRESTDERPVIVVATWQKFFHFLKKWNHFTKSNKKSDHAKMLLLRFHFNDHTSPITVQTTRRRS